MNWKKGFKRITWIVSISGLLFFTALGITAAVVENDPEIYSEIFIVGGIFFLVIWVFFFVMSVIICPLIRWVAKGFADDTSKRKQE